MKKRSPKTDLGKWKFGISKLGIAALTAGLFAVFTFLGCPIDEPVTVEYPASLNGTVWCGPTGSAGNPWATFVFHDKTGLEGTAVYYFSDHPTDIPPQTSGDPDRRTSVAYTYTGTGANAGSGTITRYAADISERGGSNTVYHFQLDPTSNTLTISDFAYISNTFVPQTFNRVATNLTEDDGAVAPNFDPNPWTPGALPADLVNTVWMGKAPNGGWLTITARDLDSITASFSVDNSTNDWNFTYTGNTGTSEGTGGTMTGMGNFNIVTTGSPVSQDVLVFSNFFGHAGQRTFYRYR